VGLGSLPLPDVTGDHGQRASLTRPDLGQRKLDRDPVALLVTADDLTALAEDRDLTAACVRAEDLQVLSGERLGEESRELPPDEIARPMSEEDLRRSVGVADPAVLGE